MEESLAERVALGQTILETSDIFQILSFQSCLSILQCASVSTVIEEGEDRINLESFLLELVRIGLETFNFSEDVVGSHVDLLVSGLH